MFKTPLSRAGVAVAAAAGLAADGVRRVVNPRRAGPGGRVVNGSDAEQKRAKLAKEMRQRGNRLQLLVLGGYDAGFTSRYERLGTGSAMESDSVWFTTETPRIAADDPDA